MKIRTQAGHGVVVDNGNWFNNDDHDNVGRGTENRAGGGSRGSRGGRGGNSGNCKGRQQSTKSSKTAAAAIYVGKRHQAREEKRGGSGVGGGSGGRGVEAAAGAAAAGVGQGFFVHFLSYPDLVLSSLL